MTFVALDPAAGRLLPAQESFAAKLGPVRSGPVVRETAHPVAANTKAVNHVAADPAPATAANPASLPLAPPEAIALAPVAPQVSVLAVAQIPLIDQPDLHRETGQPADSFLAELTADQIANPFANLLVDPFEKPIAEPAVRRGPVFGTGPLLSKLGLPKLNWPKLRVLKWGLPKWIVPRFLRPRFLRPGPEMTPTAAAMLPPALQPMANGGAVARVQTAVSSKQDLAPSRRPRWTADGWTLVRGGQIGPVLAVGAAAYGGSQAGAVLRYNLAPSSRLRPQLYARITAPLAGSGSGFGRQGEGAFGLMLRPVRRVPLAIMGEMRVQENVGNARVRPVITAITEIAPLRLPLKAEGEVYAQAGWAGGRGATPFYDLSAVVQRCVVEPGGVQLRAGGGLWSGGQRGVVRLDLGPRLELRGTIGRGARRIGVRLAADWRFRVAGRAEPGSGPAITLAAGF